MGEVFSASASVGLAFTGKRNRLGSPSCEHWPVGRDASRRTCKRVAHF